MRWYSMYWLWLSTRHYFDQTTYSQPPASVAILSATFALLLTLLNGFVQFLLGYCCCLLVQILARTHTCTCFPSLASLWLPTQAIPCRSRRNHFAADSDKQSLLPPRCTHTHTRNSTNRTQPSLAQHSTFRIQLLVYRCSCCSLFSSIAIVVTAHTYIHIYIYRICTARIVCVCAAASVVCYRLPRWFVCSFRHWLTTIASCCAAKLQLLHQRVAVRWFHHCLLRHLYRAPWWDVFARCALCY